MLLELALERRAGGLQIPGRIIAEHGRAAAIAQPTRDGLLVRRACRHGTQEGVVMVAEQEPRFRPALEGFSNELQRSPRIWAAVDDVPYEDDPLLLPTTRGTGFGCPERSSALPGLSMSTPSSAVAKRLE